ncbi:MAG TPA: GGDEF domain-containing response regulator [Candidatus Elarobacter sp.]|jgi:diguanylate cyclase (GGDEF)-like protein
MMPHPSPTTLRILLVENNPADARLVIELFRASPSLAADVRHVTRVADAFRALAEDSYDVVLVDLSLPDGFGVATLPRIRANAPHVPIVVLSGLEDDDAAIAAVHEGAQDYLVKSQIDDAGLLRAVRHAIGRHERMHRIAYFDSLTGLPNRALFRDRLTQELTRSARYGDKAALLFIDLDGLKRVNDAYGHESGDAVLALAGRRIRQGIRSSDIAARHGGDEYTVLLARLARFEDAALVAEKLRRRVSEPHHIGENDLTVGASIGVAVFPLNGTDPEQLMQQADNAMYRAKRHGRNQVVCAASRRIEVCRAAVAVDAPASAERLMVVRDVRAAVAGARPGR